MQARIGCSGWQYPEWQEIFYSKRLPKKEWFSYYASQFNSVEINYSYYRFPTETTMMSWKGYAPKNFTYSLKVNKAIIYRRFNQVEKMLDDFYGLAKLLGSHLGCLVFQFPANVRFDVELLNRMLEQLNPVYTNVIEFRHESWWRDEVITAITQANHIFCSVSAPKLPNALINCKGRAYIRFHGLRSWFRGAYPEQELQDWIEQIKLHHIKELWAYFNNTAAGHAPEDAHLLQRLLKVEAI